MNSGGAGLARAFGLVPDEPDQVLRMRDFRAAHPDVIIGPGGFGTWQARIPEPDGETVNHQVHAARTAGPSRRADRPAGLAGATRAQAVALVDITELVRDWARAAILHLHLGSFVGFRLLFSFGLGLGFPLKPCGVVAAGRQAWY